MMEDMDIDHIVDIPDTPDRPVSRHVNAGDGVGKESELSVNGHPRDSAFKDEENLHRLRCRGRIVGENGYNRRLHLHHRKNSSNIDNLEHFNDAIALSPVENPSVSRIGSLFRKTMLDKNCKHDSRYSTGAQQMDRGKQICPKFPPKSSMLHKDTSVIDLTERDLNERLLEMAFPRGRKKESPAIAIGKQQVAANSSSLHMPPNSPKPIVKSSKGKEKVEFSTSESVDSIINRGSETNISTQQNHEKQTSASYNPVSPRVTGQKRLVRNGCISPLNIEVKTKQLAERAQTSSTDAVQNPTKEMVSHDSCMVNMKDLVAEDNRRDRGKGIVSQTCTSKEDSGVDLYSSSAVKSEAIGRSFPSTNAFGCNDQVGGWRSTRNQLKKVDPSLSDATGSQSRQNVDGGSLVSNQHGSMEPYTHEHKHRTRPLQVPNQINQPRLVGNTVTKRQKKHELNVRNRGRNSRLVSDGTEIVLLDSPGESSRPRSSTAQSHQNHGTFEINELPSETTNGNSEGVVFIDEDDSAARARQVEADEMMALRLQEQLYHEMPTFGGNEIDSDIANIAWMLQQEEDAHPLYDPNPHTVHPRTSSVNSRRQPQSRLLPNPSNRRGSRARGHSSSGMESLRNRVFSRSRAASSRARNLRFPMGMDLDMRLDILEALEATVGNLSNTGVTRQISGIQRDFNESDYEMLLALDENNHQSGASSNLINSLPTSTVQTDNFEEACAICLDAPGIGETIRHLPCLHKFHKDCIDPWLSRKSSCPVCKSSIT